MIFGKDTTVVTGAQITAHSDMLIFLPRLDS